MLVKARRPLGLTVGTEEAAIVLIGMQELLRQLAESVVNETVDAEADQMCGESNSRNGYRERRLLTCVGTLTLSVPKLRWRSFFLEDVLTRYQKVARKRGVYRLPKDQARPRATYATHARCGREDRVASTAAAICCDEHDRSAARACRSSTPRTTTPGSPSRRPSSEGASRSCSSRPTPARG